MKKKPVKQPAIEPLYTYRRNRSDANRHDLFDLWDTDLVYPEMVCNPSIYVSKKPKLKKFTGPSLNTEYFYMVFHTAFRKAIDSRLSCIVYNSLSTMKDEHRALFIDTFTKMLPVKCTETDEKQVLMVGVAIVCAIEKFFKRIEGHSIDLITHTAKYDRKLYDDYIANNSDLYRSSIVALEMAIIEEYERDKNCFSGFIPYLYPV